MSFLNPDKIRRYLTDVSPELVKELGCTVVAIDADNTSSYDLTATPLPGTEDWLRSMQDAGIPVVLLSNAKAGRAKQLADHYGIPVVGMAMKPLRQGYLRVALQCHVRPNKILMLGDQLFTDILGASRTGCKTIWVLPYEADAGDRKSFAVKRAGEALLKKFWTRTGRWKELTE